MHETADNSSIDGYIARNGPCYALLLPPEYSEFRIADDALVYIDAVIMGSRSAESRSRYFGRVVAGGAATEFSAYDIAAECCRIAKAHGAGSFYPWALETMNALSCHEALPVINALDAMVPMRATPSRASPGQA